SDIIEIEKKETEIKKTNQEIDDLSKEIKKLKKEIEALKKRIEQRKEILRDRLRALQKNGGDIKYLEVLVGAQDMRDFISRASGVNALMDSDKKIVDELVKDQQALKEKTTTTKRRS